jgi:hypothetical protein
MKNDIVGEITITVKLGIIHDGGTFEEPPSSYMQIVGAGIVDSTVPTTSYEWMQEELSYGDFDADGSIHEALSNMGKTHPSHPSAVTLFDLEKPEQETDADDTPSFAFTSKLC